MTPEPAFANTRPAGPRRPHQRAAPLGRRNRRRWAKSEKILKRGPLRPQAGPRVLGWSPKHSPGRGPVGKEDTHHKLVTWQVCKTLPLKQQGA